MMQPRFGAREIISWISARKSRITTHWIPECSCVVRLCLTGLSPQSKTEPVLSPMACGSWSRRGDCEPWKSATVNGKTSTHQRRSHTPNAYLTATPVTIRFLRASQMSSALRKRRLLLRLLAGCVGVLLFAHLVRQAGPSRLLESLAALGWGLLLVLAWGRVAPLLSALVWRLTALEDKRHVSFTRMLGLRLASEAVGHFGALGQLFGEGLRVSLLGPAMPLASGITSVTVDRALFILSAALVSIVGLSALLIVLPLPHPLALYAGVSVCPPLGVVLLTAVAVKKRWPVLSGTAHLLGRVRYFSNWIGRERTLIQSVENNLLDFYHHNPGSFWASFLLHVASHAAALFDVYLILRLLAPTSIL